jgi:hypothetical protein
LFSLKSCIRIRAATIASKSSDDYLNGTVRLEAIAPQISFQAVQVRQIPFMATPLSHILLNQRPEAISGPSRLTSRFGFVTLNQKRNIVTLLETDPAVSLCPIVGVWVYVDLPKMSASNSNSNSSSHGNHDNLKLYLENPFVWGACLRYQFSERIKDRAYVSSNTFLMVNNITIKTALDDDDDYYYYYYYYYYYFYENG